MPLLEDLLVGLHLGSDEDFGLERPREAVVHAVQVAEPRSEARLLGLAENGFLSRSTLALDQRFSANVVWLNFTPFKGFFKASTAYIFLFVSSKKAR